MDIETALELKLANIFDGRDAEILVGDGFLVFEVDGDEVADITFATLDDMWEWAHTVHRAKERGLCAPRRRYRAQRRPGWSACQMAGWVYTYEHPRYGWVELRNADLRRRLHELADARGGDVCEVVGAVLI